MLCLPICEPIWAEQLPSFYHTKVVNLVLTEDLKHVGMIDLFRICQDAVCRATKEQKTNTLPVPMYLMPQKVQLSVLFPSQHVPRVRGHGALQWIQNLD
jgi:hypothetical protein